MNILVIDAQGGGIGRQLVTAVRRAIPEACIMAAGGNSAAADAMRRAGADQAAAGENAVVVACRRADYIIGPIGIVVADAMYGEITPGMAVAVGQSRARRILLPFDSCDNLIAGVPDQSMSARIQAAVDLLVREIREKRGAQP